MRAKVSVTFKEGVLDSQGKAVQNALYSLDFKNISDVKVGKLFVVDINETDRQQAHKELERACEMLLVNSVIESYEIEL